MKPTAVLFGGIFASFAAAACGLVLIPQAQIGNLQPVVDEENSDIYPIAISQEGHDAYIANGCFACHTQQVRDAHLGSDIDREWGARRTVARDYIYENTVTLGTIRNGPDLSSAGAPRADDSKRKYILDAQWQYVHLYNPRSVVEGSNMPSFRFLFKKRPISGQRSADALDLTGADAPEDGYEVVPTAEAKHLVAYLMSLDKSHTLPESKVAAPAAAKK